MLLFEAVVASFIVTAFGAVIRLIAWAGRVSALCVLHCSSSLVILHMCSALRPLPVKIYVLLEPEAYQQVQHQCR